jgi:hypothetical protein
MGMLLRRYHKTENPTVEETTNTEENPTVEETTNTEENPTVEETTDSKGLVQNVRKNSRSNSDNNE